MMVVILVGLLFFSCHPESQEGDLYDVGYLNAFFPNWFSSSSVNRLPFAYNAQRTMYWFTHEKRPGYWEAIGKIKILHYSSSPKPWEVSGGKGKFILFCFFLTIYIHGEHCYPYLVYIYI